MNVTLPQKKKFIRRQNPWLRNHAVLIEKMQNTFSMCTKHLFKGMPTLTKRISPLHVQEASTTVSCSIQLSGSGIMIVSCQHRSQWQCKGSAVRRQIKVTISNYRKSGLRVQLPSDMCPKHLLESTFRWQAVAGIKAETLNHVNH